MNQHVFRRCYRGCIYGAQIRISMPCSEKCHTSKLILRISWMNYVFEKCYRGCIYGAQIRIWMPCSEKCHTYKLILRIHESMSFARIVYVYVSSGAWTPILAINGFLTCDCSSSFMFDVVATCYRVGGVLCECCECSVSNYVIQSNPIQ